MLALLLLLAISVTARSSVIFQDCGSAYELEAVEIEGCNRAQPCFITLGEDVPVSVHFVAGFSSSLLDQNVVININFVNLETKVTPDPCDYDVCPVPTDFVTSFTSLMAVPRSMALNQRGYLRWRVYNERGQLVLCYSVLVQTQSALQKMLRRHAAAAKLQNKLNHYNGTSPDITDGDMLLEMLQHYGATSIENRVAQYEPRNDVLDVIDQGLFQQLFHQNVSADDGN